MATTEEFIDALKEQPKVDFIKSLILANSGSEIKKSHITVGTGKDYTTINDAISAINDSPSSAFVVTLDDGVHDYTPIKLRGKYVYFIGSSASACTINFKSGTSGFLYGSNIGFSKITVNVEAAYGIVLSEGSHLEAIDSIFNVGAETAIGLFALSTMGARNCTVKGSRGGLRIDQGCACSFDADFTYDSTTGSIILLTGGFVVFTSAIEAKQITAGSLVEIYNSNSVVLAPLVKNSVIPSGVSLVKFGANGEVCADIIYDGKHFQSTKVLDSFDIGESINTPKGLKLINTKNDTTVSVKNELAELEKTTASKYSVITKEYFTKHASSGGGLTNPIDGLLKLTPDDQEGTGAIVMLNHDDDEFSIGVTKQDSFDIGDNVETFVSMDNTSMVIRSQNVVRIAAKTGSTSNTNVEIKLDNRNSKKLIQAVVNVGDSYLATTDSCIVTREYLMSNDFVKALPTAEPATGGLWNDSGTLKIKVV